MSNFPYNHHKYSRIESANGSPLTYKKACKWADEILMWHTGADTDDWTQSSDGYDSNLRDLACGLMELFSDPGAVRRIMATGEVTRGNIQTLMNIRDLPNISESTKQVISVIDELFEKKE